MARTSSAAGKTSTDFMENGVTILPATPSAGEKVRVMYDGLLSKSGATDVYVHVGFGNKWENVYDYKMNKSGMGFEASIPVANAASLNLAFKDCANNWDNNSGRNYTFEIS